MSKYSKIHIGLDVHKDTIAVAVARGDCEAEYLGAYDARGSGLRRLFKKLGGESELLSF